MYYKWAPRDSLEGAGGEPSCCGADGPSSRRRLPHVLVASCGDSTRILQREELLPLPQWQDSSEEISGAPRPSSLLPPATHPRCLLASWASRARCHRCSGESRRDVCLGGSCGKVREVRGRPEEARRARAILEQKHRQG